MYIGVYTQSHSQVQTHDDLRYLLHIRHLDRTVRDKAAEHGSPVPVHCRERYGAQHRFCKRPPLWLVDGVGMLCNVHYNHFFDRCGNLIKLTQIHRISDRDEDFKL